MQPTGLSSSRLKPIVHQNGNPLALGPRIGHDSQREHFTLSPVHTEEIVNDYNPKTRKYHEILGKFFENPLEIAVFKRFSEISNDFMQIHLRFHGLNLSEACSLLQSFLCEPGFTDTSKLVSKNPRTPKTSVPKLTYIPRIGG